MSRFGNAFATGLGGVLNSVADSYGRRIENEQRANLMAERDKAELVRARAIAEMQDEFAIRKDDRARAAGMKEGREIDAEVDSRMAARDAADISKVDDPELRNLSREELAQLRTDPEARAKFGVLNAPTRKEELETRASAAGKLGYGEAAKETRGLLQTEIQNERVANADKNAERRADAADKNAEFMQKYQMRREDRMDRMAESTLAFQKARANKEDAKSEGMAEREQRAATAKALDGVNSDIKMLAKEAADPMMAPEQKAVVNQQLEQARNEAKRYRAALAGAGLDGSAEAPKGEPKEPFDPAKYMSGGKAAPSTQTAKPAQASASAAPRAESRQPKEMAIDGLDAAISKTARDMAAAGNRGDKAEVARLNAQLQEQQRAKVRIVDGSGQ